MTLWINIIFAWAALILTFFMIVIWALRLISKQKKILPLMKANRWLRRHHKLIGILLIGAGVVHGLFSSDPLLSLNLGTVTWIVNILLGVSWMLRKKLGKAWMIAHRLLTAAFAILLVIHILDVGGFILDDMIAGRIKPPSPAQQNQTSSAQQSSSGGSAAYKDGVYQGTGNGYRPGLVVEVIVEGGKIASVAVIEHNEKDRRYWGYPIEQIPKDIIAAQSTDVDSITSATMTCDGIKEAVDAALSQALAD